MPELKIVSASYRTDIPAFYSRWLLGRLAAGFCDVASPYGGRPYGVSLLAPEVQGFVLWTRNIRPLLPDLAVLAERAPFAVQFTLTAYPRALEPSVIGAEAALGQLRALRAVWGPRVAVWRYDPVLISSLTPPAWHRANFAVLATALRGVADEVVVSFAQFYRKTVRNLDLAAKRAAFSWRDPPDDEKRELLADFAVIAQENGMALTLCTQPHLTSPQIRAARCIDPARLSDIAGHSIHAREKGNRPGCRCAEARDIGGYDTCPHGCVYCYAVSSNRQARNRFAAHEPEQTSL